MSKVVDEGKIRRASHAGSWYTDNAKELDAQLEKWLNKAAITDLNARAIISPHAGYSYSGPSAAHGFKNIDKSKIKRIFVLGPSHHVYTTKCALSSADLYETPLGNMAIDKEVITDLHATGHFEWMKKSVDEAEHSLEMQLPYIVKMMEGASFTVVPIMVGSTSKKSEELYGQLLSKYFEDESNFFVISSDFCHWGKRFSYYYYSPTSDDYHDGDNDLPIYKAIEQLDHQGMEAIETLNPDTFYSYLKSTENTICGRHPIGILMQMIKYSKLNHKVKFVHYAQSNQCMSKKDSSVSYAVAVTSKI